MTTKNVCQLDGAGYFVGLVEADESPLEPGVFLIPGGAVDVEAPEIPAGKRAKWMGDSWVLEDVSSDVAPDPDPIEPVTFEDAQANLIHAVDIIARDKRNAIVADISPAEMASWPIKRAEALAYQSSGLDADAPNLVAEAAARNISLADLVAKVLAKAAQLSYIEAQIAGHAGKLQDQINAAEDKQALDAIDITAGWPT